MTNIFARLDKGEAKLGKPVDRFNEPEVLDYILTMYPLVYGRPYNVSIYKDKAVIRRMLSVYGSQGPRMIKYLFHEEPHYRGESFRLSFFAQNCRWITDDIANRMSSYLKSFESVEEHTKGHNLITLSALRDKIGA